MRERNIKHSYFEWLYKMVVTIRDEDSPLSYRTVCTHLHAVKFNATVPNDDNRASDGEELRDRFLSSLLSLEIEDYVELYSLNKPSLLEVLIALSERAGFLVDHPPQVWFNIFLTNLGLKKYSDSRFVPKDSFKVNNILKVFNERKYTSSGEGGLFPLANPKKDQRTVELWYQMQAYMNENNMV